MNDRDWAGYDIGWTDAHIVNVPEYAPPSWESIRRPVNGWRWNPNTPNNLMER